jgi:hypothetical protein
MSERKTKQRAPDHAVYDGSVFAGTVVERADGFHALDPQHNDIGAFKNAVLASRALPRAANDARQRAWQEKLTRRAGRGRS